MLIQSTTPDVSSFPRFWSKVKIGTPNECWLWMASLTEKGYGQFAIDGKMRRAHSVAYELLIGPIPEGLELDHTCRNRACVNSQHLEPVTTRVNILRGVGVAGINARKTHCKRGHEFTLENTFIHNKETPHAGRGCRICRRANSRIRNGVTRTRK